MQTALVSDFAAAITICHLFQSNVDFLDFKSQTMALEA